MLYPVTVKLQGGYLFRCEGEPILRHWPNFANQDG